MSVYFANACTQAIYIDYLGGRMRSKLRQDAIFEEQDLILDPMMLENGNLLDLGNKSLEGSIYDLVERGYIVFSTGHERFPAIAFAASSLY